ncbi:MAG: FAD-dependent oxidoreductase [Spirochaeta sp.]|jgi:uncharacterized FAD-dependent dehydrogenase|nr:FAD-dependent oxidoreductase [Spirochaeta sp.]
MKKSSSVGSEIEITLPAQSSPEELERAIARKSGGSGPFRIIRQSLDARRKPDVRWNYRIAIGKPPAPLQPERVLPVTREHNPGRAVVVGSGPAGFFAADVLNRAGWEVTLLEQGPPVEERRRDIAAFETGGPLAPYSNYSFGEGGAGTFSDGKLTSRTKQISREREYVTARYVQCGAPTEIQWLAHPHIGSDNLYPLVIAGRKDLQARGVEIRFHTEVRDLIMKDGRCVGVQSVDDEFPADRTVLAPGHSAMPLLRTLAARGATLETKGFALGVRVEHPRELINTAQWGRSEIPGLKAAEYRLTAKTSTGRGVYSFCMCPGGAVIPAAWRPGLNMVNGVSNYRRDGAWSNAAVVAALHPEEIFPEARNPLDVLARLEELEACAVDLVGTHRVPATIPACLGGGEIPGTLPRSSHPFELVPSDYRLLYPQWLLQALSEGLSDFSRKLRGYETGLILGMETTTSAAVRVVREPSGEVASIPGVWIAGEGSGAAGGIMSSAVDGIHAALAAAASNAYRA